VLQSHPVNLSVEPVEKVNIFFLMVVEYK